MTDERNGPQPEARIRALLELDRVDLIHNDLISAAHHILEGIRKAIARDDKRGIGLDMIAALTMTAFAYEAYLNFIGYTAIPQWDERAPTGVKEEKVCEELGIPCDREIRPFSTLETLRELRNILAHGKPIATTRQWEAVGTHEELQAQLVGFKPNWQKSVTIDFLEEAYADVDQAWKLMLASAKIDVFETLDHGSSVITFLSYADQHPEAAEE